MQLWGIQLGKYSAHYAFRGHALKEGCLYQRNSGMKKVDVQINIIEINKLMVKKVRNV
jgi:hypothetical protein